MCIIVLHLKVFSARSLTIQSSTYVIFILSANFKIAQLLITESNYVNKQIIEFALALPFSHCPLFFEVCLFSILLIILLILLNLKFIGFLYTKSKRCAISSTELILKPHNCIIDTSAPKVQHLNHSQTI